MIETDVTYENNIEGLGNSQLAIGYYEFSIYEWYRNQKLSTKIKPSPYDALSLCFILIKSHPKYSTNVKKGILWYKRMIKKYEKDFRFWMGYANLLSEKGEYE